MVTDRTTLAYMPRHTAGRRRVGHAGQERVDGASLAALAGPPAADDGFGVADVLDLDPVPLLAAMVGRDQRLADYSPGHGLGSPPVNRNHTSICSTVSFQQELYALVRRAY